MKKIIAAVIAMVFIAGCSKEIVHPVPTGNVDNFYNDAREVIRMFYNKSEYLSPLTEDEDELLQGFLDRYMGNPRLDESQNSLITKISMLDAAYLVYTYNKDSKKTDDIKSTNEAIETFFTYIKKFDENGDLIEE